MASRSRTSRAWTRRRSILAALRAEKIDVWSTDNPKGEKLAMLMIEDPGALAQAAEFANLQGYSILACGIGSLTGALGGDRAQGEAGRRRSSPRPSA